MVHGSGTGTCLDTDVAIVTLPIIRNVAPRTTGRLFDEVDPCHQGGADQSRHYDPTLRLEIGSLGKS